MKKWFMSKTIIVALAQLAVAVIIAFVGQFPNAEWVSTALMVKSILDMWLRSVTTQPIVADDIQE